MCGTLILPPIDAILTIRPLLGDLESEAA